MDARLESTVCFMPKMLIFSNERRSWTTLQPHAFQGSEISNHNQLCACKPVLKETGHAKCAYMHTVCWHAFKFFLRDFVGSSSSKAIWCIKSGCRLFGTVPLFCDWTGLQLYTAHLTASGTQLPQMSVTFKDRTKPPTPFLLGGPGSSQHVPELKFIYCSSTLTGFTRLISLTRSPLICCLSDFIHKSHVCLFILQ